MLESGNSKVQVCAGNLIRTFQGEVPYEREMGIDPDIVDDRANAASYLIADSVNKCFDRYEPRINTEDIDVNTILEDGTTGFGVSIEEVSE